MLLLSGGEGGEEQLNTPRAAEKGAKAVSSALSWGRPPLLCPATSATPAHPCPATPALPPLPAQNHNTVGTSHLGTSPASPASVPAPQAALTAPLLWGS